MPSSLFTSKFSTISPLNAECASKSLTTGFDAINLLKLLSLISGVVPIVFELVNNFSESIPFV